jgi:ribose-phosphate pyrophosphokinase
MYIDFNLALADGSVSAFYFSGGEPHVKIPTYEDFELNIIARINSWEEFGLFLAYINAIGEQTHITKQPHDLNIYLPYFPGSRQDRSDGFSPLTVRLYVDLILASVRYHDGLNLYTFDMHSEMGHDLVSSKVWFGELCNLQVNELDPSYFDKDIVGIIVPDKGAIGRAALFGATFYEGCELVQCEKEREFNTGHITSYSLPPGKYEGKYLVVDDICDGGATFNILADSIAEKNKNVELQLYVSHGIFSKGLNFLFDRYSKIYTTDSIATVEVYAQDYPQLTVMPVPNPFVKNEVKV